MWTPLRTAGRIQRVSVENEKADAGREGRTHLAIIDSQARTGTGYNLKEKSELVLCIFYINLSGVNHTGTQ